MGTRRKSEGRRCENETVGRCMCTGWTFYPRVGEWVTRRAGVPDKTILCFGYLVPVFCTDLNLFYNRHFPIFNSSVGWIVNFSFQDCHQVPSASVHCNQNEAVNKDNQICQYPLHMSKCCRMCSPLTLWHEYDMKYFFTAIWNMIPIYGWKDVPSFFKE